MPEVRGSAALAWTVRQMSAQKMRSGKIFMIGFPDDVFSVIGICACCSCQKDADSLLIQPAFLHFFRETGGYSEAIFSSLL
jgi:hypothetical protein